MANRLSTEQRTRIVGCLTEGMSIRATVRVTGAAKNTITKLLVDLGAACADYQDVTLRNLPCERLQCDEIWSFCRAKAKNVPTEHEGEFGYGDVWTWTAICADTKLVPSWLVGHRDTEDATIFIADLAARLANRVQLTTDGHRPYLSAVESAFGADIDYAMLVKIYGSPTGAGDERRYSPAVCTGIDKRPITGSPDRGSISTSYVERQNLTIRMGMRRFTRLTNGFSKSLLANDVALAGAGGGGSDLVTSACRSRVGEGASGSRGVSINSANQKPLGCLFTLWWPRRPVARWRGAVAPAALAVTRRT